MRRQATGTPTSMRAFGSRGEVAGRNIEFAPPGGLECGAFRVARAARAPGRGYLVGRSLLVCACPGNRGGRCVSLPATAGAATRHGSLCVSRHVVYVEGKIDVHYRPGCTGHDEPELDPVSSLPHSAKNLTWKFVLPIDGKFPVAGTGFGFWFGGTVTDPNPKALFHQGFLEVQFYPDTLVSKCFQNGNSTFTFAKNTYTVCSPVWSVVGNNEPAAFDAMLRKAGTQRKPLVMHGGDTITLHYYGTPAQRRRPHRCRRPDHPPARLDRPSQQAHRRHEPGVRPPGDRKRARLGHRQRRAQLVRVGDRPPLRLQPAPGRVLRAGPQRLRVLQLAGVARDDSPIQILGVTFGDRGAAKHWAVVSDYGGKAADPRSEARPGRPARTTAGRTASTRGSRQNHERLVHLRRQLPVDGGRLRQGQPVRAARRTAAARSARTAPTA